MHDAPTTHPAVTGYAVVTGAACGIGWAVAQRLCGMRWAVALVDNDAGRLDEAHDALSARGGVCVALGADVASASDWASVHSELRALWPRLDLLVNNAGVLTGGALVASDPHELGRVLDANLKGQLLGCWELAPWLIDSSPARPKLPGPRPGIINTASVFAALAPPGFAAYCASKAGVVALSESLRGELAPHGLNVTVTAPGVARTDLFRRATFHGPGYREAAERFLQESRLTPEEVADATLRAAGRGVLYAVIGGRARRLWTLKRWFPSFVTGMLSRWSSSELGAAPVARRATAEPATREAEPAA